MYVDRIISIERELKEMTYTTRYFSYIFLHLEIDSVGWLRMNSYDKREGLNFPSLNFPFICSNIPAELLPYSRVCGSYQDFLDIWLLLTKMLLDQGFLS